MQVHEKAPIKIFYFPSPIFPSFQQETDDLITLHAPLERTSREEEKNHRAKKLDAISESTRVFYVISRMPLGVWLRCIFHIWRMLERLRKSNGRFSG